MRSINIFIILTILPAVILIGCNTIESDNTQSIALNSIFMESSGKAETDSTVLVDSIFITEARFCLRDLKMTTLEENDSTIFKSGLFVFAADITGEAQQINTIDVEPVTYTTVEYDIIAAAPEIIEQLPEEEKAEFSDFTGTSADDSYSIIIDGVVFIDSTMEAFTYKSQLNVSRRDSVVKNILVPEGGGTTNATLLIDSYYWFRDTAAGTIYNPGAALTSDQTAKIDSNLTESIKVFRDRNKDGTPD